MNGLTKQELEIVEKAVNDFFYELEIGIKEAVEYYLKEYSIEFNFNLYNFSRAMYAEAITIIPQKLEKDGFLYSVHTDAINSKILVSIKIMNLTQEQENFYNQTEAEYIKIATLEINLILFKNLFFVIFISILISAGIFVTVGKNLETAFLLFIIGVILCIPILLLICYKQQNIKRQEIENDNKIKEYSKKNNIKILIPKKYYLK